MIEEVFRILVGILGLYAFFGVVVAALLFTRWLGIFDPSAKDGSVGFRVLVTPGIIALWPFIVMKIFLTRKPAYGGGAETLRRNHRIAFMLVAILGALLFTLALVWRAPGFDDLPTTELSNP